VGSCLLSVVCNIFTGRFLKLAFSTAQHTVAIVPVCAKLAQHSYEEYHRVCWHKVSILENESNSRWAYRKYE
jgi:hypothetical protein